MNEPLRKLVAYTQVKQVGNSQASWTGYPVPCQIKERDVSQIYMTRRPEPRQTSYVLQRIYHRAVIVAKNTKTLLQFKCRSL